MGFKENLLKKMEINTTAAKIAASMGPPDSGRRIDKDLVRKLLAEGGYEKIVERDMELYRLSPLGDKPRLLVLDNDLSIYSTSVDDVVLRKSPVVKEMLNIRNVIKILNDADVVICKKGESIRTIQEELIAGLDLHFEAADIKAIYDDGRVSLESKYAEGIEETLLLFGELLGYTSPPAALRLAHHLVLGQSSSPPGKAFGPAVLFDRMHFALKLIDQPVVLTEAPAVVQYQKIAAGEAKADASGADVLAYLRDAVMALHRPPASPAIEA
ncbi:MAG: hypothetical protein JJV98_08230 [Desulfosarcina sp.]|nr:hypothetical protein [Desulfobacterales bacterium]